MKTITVLCTLLIVCIQSLAQSEVYNITQIEIKKPYNETSPFAKYRYDSISYKKARKQTEYVYEKFNYKSDEFVVEGFSCRPKTTGGKKFPVIIYILENYLKKIYQIFIGLLRMVLQCMHQIIDLSENLGL